MKSDEKVLQYVQPGNEGEGELIIGLDFGTSASKVVIRATDVPGRPGYAVNFGDYAHHTMPFLLPTKLSVKKNGACSLTLTDDAQWVNDIKLELFSKQRQMFSNRGATELSLSSEAAAVTYLAILFRYARRWFLETHHDLVGHFSNLRWQVTMGVPSPCIEENEENQRFLRVGKAAWMLSTLPEDKITMRRAFAELEEIDDPEYWNSDNSDACEYDILPEIVAGAVSYALSDLRRDGLHLMIDIGAATIDVCSFILHKQDYGNQFSLLIADVQQYGTIRLHWERINALTRAHEKQSSNLRDNHDPLSPLAEDHISYLIPHDQLVTEIKHSEAELRRMVIQKLRGVIWKTKVMRDPNSPIWRQGRLPILLIGGGSKLEFFSAAVSQLHDWLSTVTHNEGIQLIPIPVPDLLKEDNIEYHRLAVAWGLSYGVVDLGMLTPADRIDDVPPPDHKEWITYPYIDD